MLIFDIKQQNFVMQLSFDKKINLKKECHKINEFYFTQIIWHQDFRISDILNIWFLDYFNQHPVGTEGDN